MVGGTYGKILHIDLATNNIHIEQPSEDFYRLLVGGRALVAYFLLRDLPAQTDPFSPDNLLIFAPGIMQGSNLPGSGRHGVGGKSPLTGALGSSEVGGWWGHEFKRAGFDALVIQGKAKSPVYLWIQNGHVEFRPADHLWGLTTAPTEAAIRSELEDEKVRIAQIGPAGENLVRYAAIMHDINRAAGRNGLGALMGSKNLKAIAVRGTLQPPAPVNRSKVTSIAKWFGKHYKTLMDWATAGVGIGTLNSVAIWDHLGALPTNNFSKPLFDEAEKLDGHRIHKLFLKDRDTCQACPVKCKQVFEHEDDDPSRRIDPVYGGAEYEAVSAFGSNCGVSDPVSVLKANELCNAYGLDTISTGMSISFVMECFEHGLLTSEDTDGVVFKWGDQNLIVRIVEMIALREGFGDIMAEGVNRMSARFGSESELFNLTIKGQEIPLHEPRLKQGMGLGFALSPMGADHIVNIHDTYFMADGVETQRVNSVLEEPIAPITNLGLDEPKLQIMHHEINWQHFQDCAVNCHFYSYEYAHMAEALSGVTGIDYTVHDVLNVGARAQTLARLFNLREGLTADDDKLPKRLMKAFESGPLEGIKIPHQEFAWAKQRFYELMNWDPKTGKPTTKCLNKLELDQLLEFYIDENNIQSK